MKRTYAVAWASGLIELRADVPDGACVICSGPDKAVSKFMEITARHGKGKAAGQLLVPGVPEAANQSAGMDALIAHMQWLKQSVPAGVQMGGR